MADQLGQKDSKRVAILQAALEEFAQNGYDLASTNEIIKEAGVSKGLVFHYFGSKRELFLQLLDQVIQQMSDQYISMTKHMPNEPIDYLLTRMRIKQELTFSYSLETEFLRRAWMPIPNGLENDLNQRVEKLSQMYGQNMWKYVDFGKLKPGVSQEIARLMLESMIDGLSHKYYAQLSGMAQDWKDGIEDMYRQSKSCLELLRIALYENEE